MTPGLLPQPEKAKREPASLPRVRASRVMHPHAHPHAKGGAWATRYVYQDSPEPNRRERMSEALLPQPGGFEGFGSLLEHPKASDLPVLESEHLRASCDHFDPLAPPQVGGVVNARVDVLCSTSWVST